MRSAREIRDRLWQESVNLLIWKFPPRLSAGNLPASPLPLLPPPSAVAAQLASSSFPEELRGYAQKILRHRFPLLGLEIETGPEIRWRRDSVNGVETDCRYFRLIPYLDTTRAGDHKIIWELNRHQHLVLLAQLHLFDGDPELLAEIWRQLESWLDANPFQRGINWTSALEVAFRAFSWIWIYHLAGNEMPAPLRARFLESLQAHGRHLEVNLSFYFSPNTHLLGEAVVLHALGVLFPGFPRSTRWRDLGARVVAEQLDRQVRDDGAHFEQSAYYHVYALDMFLFHGILAGAGEPYREKIARMADFLAAVQGPSRELPFIGDDDGGRFFHPFGARAHFGRATLATCAAWLGRADWTYQREDLFSQAAWWLGPTEGSATAGCSSKLFRETGLAVMTAGDRHILIDAGPFGPWGSGHSHSDTLSIVARAGDHQILIDPGTYTYVGDPVERNWFRGSAAHNTVRIDGLDQATPVNPFRWQDQPAVSIREWRSSGQEDFLDAQCVSH
ncbi:MAG: heparinase II/III family protein, partial [Acidobacteriia bacterium]|nr:heparinase II/III family protein [Terriglobia bacterium]